MAANPTAPWQHPPSASCPFAQPCSSPSASPGESPQLQDLGLDLPAASCGFLLCLWREDCSPHRPDDDLPEFPHSNNSTDLDLPAAGAHPTCADSVLLSKGWVCFARAAAAAIISEPLRYGGCHERGREMHPLLEHSLWI